jgi:putative ABC transport system permease protein
MTIFAIHTTLSRNKKINKKFKYIVGFSLSSTGILMVMFFIIIVVDVNFFNPQYTIPISGMIIGNAMTGVSLGVKTYYENVFSSRNRIVALLNMGVVPNKILNPFMNTAVETALLPTLNSMLGMGVISLPGMMTGQILSGTLPTTAILYQIAIIVAICAVTCLAVFCTLFFGSRTMYNKRNQIIFE